METKKEVKPPVKKLGKTVKVKNTSKRPLNLVKGTIEPDKVGTATIAEYRTLYKRLEVV